MKSPARRRKPYVSVKEHLRLFGAEAERFSERYGFLVGVERLGGYVDSKGAYIPPAVSLHVDGVAYRVSSVLNAIDFLRGMVAGFEFLQAGRVDFVTRSEVERIVKELTKKG